MLVFDLLTLLVFDLHTLSQSTVQSNSHPLSPLAFMYKQCEWTVFNSWLGIFHLSSGCMLLSENQACFTLFAMYVYCLLGWPYLSDLLTMFLCQSVTFMLMYRYNVNYVYLGDAEFQLIMGWNSLSHYVYFIPSIILCIFYSLWFFCRAFHFFFIMS